MAIKRRYARLTTGTTGGTGTGTAQARIGLGAPYGTVLGFEFKGDDANVDANNTLALTDADGRLVLKATALDAGTDDSTLKRTSQDFSTVGVRGGLVEDEAEVYQGSAGAKTTDNVGAGGGILAKSPITVDIAAGTDGDVQEVALFVEV
jgi:hypothetical protein